MKLYEYQGKTLFSKFGIRTPQGAVAYSTEEILQLLPELKYPVMVKAQVLSGGRGKAGGVKSVSSAQELAETAGKMLGSKLKEAKIEALLIEEQVDFAEEYYLSVTLDSASKMPVIIFSLSGGVDIEEVAVANPEKIIKILIDPLIGLQGFHFEKLFKKSGIIEKGVKDQLKDIVFSLYRLYEDYDAMLVEINPLMKLSDGSLLAADAKIEIDDSAIYRHDDLLQWNAAMDVDPLVKMARDVRFLYIDVDPEGSVGVISNGSGMIMSCVDWIAREGGKVVCALDLGGGATSERVAQGIKIMLLNKKIKALLISIFGGITRCDEIAGGILKAVEEFGISVPLVVRLDGTNKEKGMDLLEAAHYERVLIAHGLKDAALKVISAQNS